MRGQGTARGEVEPAEFHSKWRKVLVSVAVIFNYFLPKFWPKQLAFSDLIAFLGGQEPIALVGALSNLKINTPKTKLKLMKGNGEKVVRGGAG